MAQRFQVTLEGDFDLIAGADGSPERAAFEGLFVESAATALGVEGNRVEVISVERGSVIVSAEVVPANVQQGEALPAAVAALRAAPAERLSALASAYDGVGISVVWIGGPPTPAPPLPPAPATCPESFLGYACSAPTGDAGVTVHWSTSGAMPDNACTAAAARTSAAAPDSDGMLHMAISAESSGLLGLGFPRIPGRMLNSDVALGWVAGDGSAVAGAWRVGGDYYSIRADNAAGWADFVAVSETSEAGSPTRTVVCFSRPLAGSPAAAASALPAVDPDADVDLIYAVSPGQYSFGVQHRTDGALRISLGTGGAALVEQPDKRQKLYVHAALMTVAWVFLLPLGALVARHRWLPGANTNACGKQVWFWIHMGCQLSGMVLFIVAFAYAWEFLPGGGLPVTGGSVGKGHQVLGTVVMGLACLQIVVAFVRPAPDNAKLRPAWNMVHHNLGRVAILASWATVYMGVYIGHGSPTYQLSYAAWITPIAIVMGLLVIADVVLTVMREAVARRERSGDAEVTISDSAPVKAQPHGIAVPQQLPGGAEGQFTRV